MDSTSLAPSRKRGSFSPQLRKQLTALRKEDFLAVCRLLVPGKSASAATDDVAKIVALTPSVLSQLRYGNRSLTLDEHRKLNEALDKAAAKEHGILAARKSLGRVESFLRPTEEEVMRNSPQTASAQPLPPPIDESINDAAPDLPGARHPAPAVLEPAAQSLMDPRMAPPASSPGSGQAMPAVVLRNGAALYVPLGASATVKFGADGSVVVEFPPGS